MSKQKCINRIQEEIQNLRNYFRKRLTPIKHACPLHQSIRKDLKLMPYRSIVVSFQMLLWRTRSEVLHGLQNFTAPVLMISRYDKWRISSCIVKILKYHLSLSSVTRTSCIFCTNCQYYSCLPNTELLGGGVKHARMIRFYKRIISFVPVDADHDWR